MTTFGTAECAGAECAGIAAYTAKSDGYFAGSRPDWVSELPVDPSARVLEIGCGSGGTGALALQDGKCGHYCGVELCPRAAERARQRLSDVIVGDIESLSLPRPSVLYDVLILSEVLEHLRDPLAVLRKLHPLLRAGARVFASSPNVAHYRVILMILGGEWRMDDAGAMDRTHLRWFTPRTYQRMFELAGYRVERVKPMEKGGIKARAIGMLTGGRGWHLLARQIDLRAVRA